MVGAMLNSYTCAKCNSTELHRSEVSNIFEWWLASVVTPYRCPVCWQRQFRWRFIRIGPSTQVSTGAASPRTAPKTERTEQRPGTPAEPPTVIERRKSKAKCRSCGSSDLYRVAERSGILASIMKFRGRKPHQCRACGWIFYRPARRSNDNAIPFLSGEPAPNTVANLPRSASV